MNFELLVLLRSVMDIDKMHGDKVNTFKAKPTENGTIQIESKMVQTIDPRMHEGSATLAILR